MCTADEPTGKEGETKDIAENNPELSSELEAEQLHSSQADDLRVRIRRVRDETGLLSYIVQPNTLQMQLPTQPSADAVFDFPSSPPLMNLNQQLDSVQSKSSPSIAPASLAKRRRTTAAGSVPPSPRAYSPTYTEPVPSFSLIPQIVNDSAEDSHRAAAPLSRANGSGDRSLWAVLNVDKGALRIRLRNITRPYKKYQSAYEPVWLDVTASASRFSYLICAPVCSYSSQSIF